MIRARGALVLACGAVLGVARADVPAAEPASARPLLVRLAPTAHAVHEARTRALEQRLQHTLAQLPEVRRAALQLSLPLAAEQPLDQPLPAAAATLVLQVEGEPPSRQELWQLLRGPVPQLALENFTLIVRNAVRRAAPESLVPIGPFRVAPESAAPLRVLLGMLLGTNLLLAVVLLWRSSRAVVARTVARWAAKRSR